MGDRDLIVTRPGSLSIFGRASVQDWIGWGSAAILVPAFATQTYRQWHDRDRPVHTSALWFFVLVLIGTAGQVAYSWMVRNWVYLALNGVLVVNNAIGLGIAVHRWIETRKRTSGPTSAAKPTPAPGS